MKTLYFATSNKGKVKEFTQSLSSIKVDVVQKNIPYPEIQANSLEEVALFGAKYLQKKFVKPFVLEDAGLFIDPLNGFPGVYSAYVFHTIGCDGILKLMENIRSDKRKACFKSVIAYVEPKKRPILFIGDCHGKISAYKSGDHGFGYDPIFIPDNNDKTFAQMEIKIKNKFSHRGKSLEKLISFLKG